MPHRCGDHLTVNPNVGSWALCLVLVFQASDDSAVYEMLPPGITTVASKDGPRGL